MLDERTASGYSMDSRKARSCAAGCSGNVGVQESPRELLVVARVDRVVAQVVSVDELVEDVRAEHDRGGYGDPHAVELVRDAVRLDESVREREAASLAAERAAADLRQPPVVVERRGIEVDDVPPLLAEAELAEPADQVLAERGDRGVVLESPRSELVREPELRPRLQPGAEVVPDAVVPDALVRDRVEHGLERAEVRGPRHLVAFGVPEHEVAEAELIHHEVGQPADQAARALPDEGDAERRRRAGRFSGSEDCRRIGMSGCAARTCVAKSMPALGSFSPPCANVTSEISPITLSW